MPWGGVPRVTLNFVGFPASTSSRSSAEAPSRRVISEIPELSRSSRNTITIQDLVLLAKRDQLYEDDGVDPARCVFYTSDFAAIPKNSPVGVLRDGESVIVAYGGKGRGSDKDKDYRSKDRADRDIRDHRDGHRESDRHDDRDRKERRRDDDDHHDRRDRDIGRSDKYRESRDRDSHEREGRRHDRHDDDDHRPKSRPRSADDSRSSRHHDDHKRSSSSHRQESSSRRHGSDDSLDERIHRSSSKSRDRSKERSDKYSSRDSHDDRHSRDYDRSSKDRHSSRDRDSGRDRHSDKDHGRDRERGRDSHERSGSSHRRSSSRERDDYGRSSSRHHDDERDSGRTKSSSLSKSSSKLWDNWESPYKSTSSRRESSVSRYDDNKYEVRRSTSVGGSSPSPRSASAGLKISTDTHKPLTKSSYSFSMTKTKHESEIEYLEAEVFAPSGWSLDVFTLKKELLHELEQAKVDVAIDEERHVFSVRGKPDCVQKGCAVLNKYLGYVERISIDALQNIYYSYSQENRKWISSKFAEIENRGPTIITLDGSRANIIVDSMSQEDKDAAVSMITQYLREDLERLRAKDSFSHTIHFDELVLKEVKDISRDMVNKLHAKLSSHAAGNVKLDETTSDISIHAKTLAALHSTVKHVNTVIDSLMKHLKPQPNRIKFDVTEDDLDILSKILKIFDKKYLTTTRIIFARKTIIVEGSLPSQVQKTSEYIRKTYEKYQQGADLAQILTVIESATNVNPDTVTKVPPPLVVNTNLKPSTSPEKLPLPSVKDVSPSNALSMKYENIWKPAEDILKKLKAHGLARKARETVSKTVQFLQSKNPLSYYELMTAEIGVIMEGPMGSNRSSVSHLNQLMSQMVQGLADVGETAQSDTEKKPQTTSEEIRLTVLESLGGTPLNDEKVALAAEPEVSSVNQEQSAAASDSLVTDAAKELFMTKFKEYYDKFSEKGSPAIRGFDLGKVGAKFDNDIIIRAVCELFSNDPVKLLFDPRKKVVIVISDANSEDNEGIFAKLPAFQAALLST
ncbi:hypothetical protein HDV05_001964 [Chytridiales sp. JEL 0842]|nr:hypothetical protein HDV05_001964 [Chytridiales sp. JEL 0842]